MTKITSGAPVALGTIIKGVKAKFNGNTKISVTHREFVYDVVATGNASTLENVVTLPLDAGDANTFPWLAGVANSYTKYRFKKVVVEYVTECTSSINGQFLLALQLDPGQDATIVNGQVSLTPLPTKQAFSAYNTSLQCSVWQNASVTVPCTNEWLDVAYGTLPYPTVGVLRQQAMGVVQFGLANSESSSTTHRGSVYISYEVELAEPNGQGPQGLGSEYSCSTTDSTHPFNSGLLISGNMNITTPLTTGFSFLGYGYFLVVFEIPLNGSASATPTFSSNAGSTIKSSTSSSSATQLICVLSIQSTVPMVNVGISGATNVSTVATTTIRVAQYPVPT